MIQRYMPYDYQNVRTVLQKTLNLLANLGDVYFSLVNNYYKLNNCCCVDNAIPNSCFSFNIFNFEDTCDCFFLLNG